MWEKFSAYLAIVIPTENTWLFPNRNENIFFAKLLSRLFTVNSMMNVKRKWENFGEAGWMNLAPDQVWLRFSGLEAPLRVVFFKAFHKTGFNHRLFISIGQYLIEHAGGIGRVSTALESAAGTTQPLGWERGAF